MNKTLRPRHLPQRLALLLACLAAVPASAADAFDPTALSLEELINIEITSVAKKSQRLSDAAAAITVITAEDIRRSGATSLPDALRLAPGVHVAQIDASRSVVGMRGFGGRWSSKLLVLLDGRTLYSPLFAGVYWEAQDVLLADVERIEVIRGPGGTLWGANAVNGVINIITRGSAQTQGSLVEARAGTLERGIAVRHGGRLGEIGHFRVHAKFDRHDDLEMAGNLAAHDAWRQGRAGFRADFAPPGGDRLTLQGDLYDKDADQLAIVSIAPPAGFTGPVRDTARLSGANLLFRWERALAEGAEWKFQAYLDQTRLSDINLDQRIDTADFEFQHRFPLGAAQEITWGAGYRRVADDLRSRGYTISFSPQTRSTALYSLFVQDEIRLRADLRLTVGAKFEHNDFTGFEYQPSARLMWQATPTDNLWGAVSRAVQTPSRALDDSQLNFQVLGPFGPVLAGHGNREVQSENLLAWEIGYRGRFGPHFTLDATAFINDYSKLISREPQPPIGPLINNRYENRFAGRTRGYELDVHWQPQPGWRLNASYSRFAIDISGRDSADATYEAAGEGSDPRHLVKLHSRHDLGSGLEFDAGLHHSSRLAALGVAAHTRLDLRLGWRPRPDLDLDLIGRNLLDRRHAEYLGQDVQAGEVPRSLLARLKLRF